jgi:glycosyltransferase involved in cell wall biosynthesis
VPRIGVLSVGAASDVRSWSGIPASILQTLSASPHPVVDLSPLRVPLAPLRHRAFAAAERRGRSYRYELDAQVLRSFGRQFDRLTREADVHAVVATSVLPLARASSSVPTLVWADATFDLLCATYAEYRSLPRRVAQRARDAERLGMERATVLAFASQWAAESAVTDAGADPSKVLVAPFGANLVPATDPDLRTLVDRRRAGPCHLVWIGADWVRKRGHVAVAVFEELRARGVPVTMTMAGGRPAEGARLPEGVQHLGFVDRNTAAGRRTLSEVLERSAFLLLPSTAEAFGIAVAEANAFGVPAVACRVGGLVDAVAEGRNGHLVDVEAPVLPVAALVERCWHDAAAYERLVTGARSEFEHRLNWGVSCGTVLDALLERC